MKHSDILRGNRALVSKDGELLPEVRDYVDKWVKKHSDEINARLIEKTSRR